MNEVVRELAREVLAAEEAHRRAPTLQKREPPRPATISPRRTRQPS